MRYLDPKADLTFKKVFGEHPDVVRSFLNALLPLPADAEIEEIEYLPAELVPVTPLRKNSIVDVRCKDQLGRQFLVEMQMLWSPEFKQRVLFNASKAYVRQLDVKENYKLLQPVYSLNLVNEIFEPELPEYYHHYKVLHVEHSDRVIEGIQLVFVELPKFTPHTLAEKRMQVLWLRFLTEVNEKTLQVPQELLAEPEIQKAVDVLEESGFTAASDVYKRQNLASRPHSCKATMTFGMLCVLSARSERALKSVAMLKAWLKAWLKASKRVWPKASKRVWPKASKRAWPKENYKGAWLLRKR